MGVGAMDLMVRTWKNDLFSLAVLDLRTGLHHQCVCSLVSLGVKSTLEA